MAIDVSRFHKVFFEECFEGLEAMESGLLHLAESPDVEVINTVFRAAHTIKGSSGSLGFIDLAQFTHFLETLLDEMRAGKQSSSRENIRALLESVDCLREMIESSRDEKPLNRPRMESCVEDLKALLVRAEGTAELASEASSQPPVDSSVQWRVTFRPYPALFRTGNDPARILRELERLGDLDVAADCERVPQLAAMDPEECYLSWTLLLTGDVDERQIRDVFDWVEADCDLTVEKLTSSVETAQSTSEPVETKNNTVTPGTPNAPAAESPKSNKSGSEASSIRVGTDKVDAIINLVGELVITQSMLNCFGDQFDMSMLEKLRDGLSLLARNTRELQETVLKIRMLPISFTFNRFPRLVHDLSLKLDKKIALKLTGEQTELDKTVLEKISDPLMHLVRNSLDHGIEKPAVRLQAGKPETGTIHLHAAHQGGSVVIEIHDDGAGLNFERILAKARSKNLVGPDEQLTEDRICDLIFAPGFSTADEVTDISGRGVGMDVVRRNIKELGGNIETKTRPGKGTSFFIRLPLTLAILDGQLVRVADQTYVIPLVSIVESLQVKTSQVKCVAGGTELYRLRDEYIPILRLYEIFGLEPQITKLEDGLLVIVEADNQRAGIFVDDLLAQQQVVIKSLESNFRRVDGLSGATILGDGTVSMILDITGILKLARTHRPSREAVSLEPVLAA